MVFNVANAINDRGSDESDRECSCKTTPKSMRSKSDSDTCSFVESGAGTQHSIDRRSDLWLWECNLV